MSDTRIESNENERSGPGPSQNDGEGAIRGGERAPYTFEDFEPLTPELAEHFAVIRLVQINRGVLGGLSRSIAEHYLRLYRTIHEEP